MAQTIHIHQFDNGLTLLAESMPWLESAAFVMTTPCGSSRDPEDVPGLSNFTSEMVQRGAGERDSRTFTSALENLGVVYDSSVTNLSSGFRAAMPADKLPQALELYADLLRRPQLPADQLEEARQVCLQEIRGVEDDLAGRTLRELRKRLFPQPYGRRACGEWSAIEAITENQIRSHYQACYGPEDAVISVAGKIDFVSLRTQLDSLFGDWERQPLPAVTEQPGPEGYLHLDHETSQTHIALGYSSVPYAHDDYYRARGAVGVLSDGMSSRLFTEVRELRGLCYAVFASYHSLPQYGGIECYVGTTTDKAQESLDVLLQELQKLGLGVQPHEVDRLKARYKSALIMQQESSMSRAGHMAHEWRLLGRVRTMDEVRSAIEGLSSENISEYLRDHPPQDFRLVTLGAEPLEVPVGIS